MAVVLAAGAVVWREHGGKREVLIIHRPEYGDWTLPKGKLERGESLPEAAVRETREEAGVEVVLDVPLDVVAYKLTGGDRKLVHYWRARCAGDAHHPRGHEVDKVRWIDADGSLHRLSFARDRRAVRQAMSLPATTPVALVRHGKAMARRNFSGGPDVLRPLVRRGQQQARDLRGILSAYGIRDLRSSAGTRCWQTLEPAARSAGVPITCYDLLTEETGEDRPVVVQGFVGLLARRAVLDRTPLALCGHRPLLPGMLAALGLEPRQLGTGDVVVAHLARDGQPIAFEHHVARR